MQNYYVYIFLKHLVIKKYRKKGAKKYVKICLPGDEREFINRYVSIEKIYLASKNYLNSTGSLARWDKGHPAFNAESRLP